MTTAASLCRSCNLPIEWRDTDAGRRPFNADGSSHFTTCMERHHARKPATSNGANLANREREIRGLACLKAAATFAAGKCLGGNTSLSSLDVLKVAEAFEAWIVKGGEPAA
jgi:hypothetical protein